MKGFAFPKRFFPAAACAAFVFCAASARVPAVAAPSDFGESEKFSFPGAEMPDPFSVAPLRERFLARDGRVFVGVYLSADGAESGDVSAGLDVAEWISRVAGAREEIPVETEGEDPRSLAEIPSGIYIGNTRAAAKLGIFAPAGEGDTYVVETRGNAVFIVGKNPSATRIAAGEFLKKALGVAFVFPGADGAEWEPRAEIPFPRFRLECVPAVPWRLVGVGDATWAAHLGFGELPRFSHNLGGIFTKKVYAENPGLAPVLFGARRGGFAGYYAPQPNLAHPEAAEVAAEAAHAFFEKYPDAPMFPLGINDSTNWDESEISERAYGTLSFFRNLPDRSDYYYAFVNRVAEKVAARDGRSVGAIAYMDVQNAPSFPVRENVVPVLCADRSMWIFPGFREEDKALMRRWAASGAKAWGIYDYYYGTPFLFPRLFLEEEARAIKFFAENGGRIFYAECGPVVAFDAPKIWLASELLKNPGGDPEKILDEFCATAFGAAAPAMRKFYGFCCEVWRNQGGQCRWIKGWNNENSIEIFPPEKLAEARAFLSEAFAAVRGSAAAEGDAPSAARERRILARLDAVDFALRRAEKFAESYFARKALSNAPAGTLEETLALLRSPAWRCEELYDDAEFRSRPFQARISAYLFSDPRPAALRRALDFLEATTDAQEKEQAERALERVFGAALRSRLGDGDVPATASASSPKARALARLRELCEAAPFFDAAPDTREDFEKEDFVAYEPGDWRSGRNLTYPRGWRSVFAAAEKFEIGPSEVRPHGGKSCLRVGGNAERMELRKRYRVAPGKKVLAQVFARGSVSCGSVSYIDAEFFDAAGKSLGRATDSLPVGNTPEWRRLVALATAPAGAAYADVSIYVGLQGEGDETFFDDLTVSVLDEAASVRF